MSINYFALSTQGSLFITFLASFLVWLMVLGLIVLWITDGKVKRELILHVFFVSIISWAASEAVKSFIPAIRPFLLYGNPPLTITIPFGASFPSSHAAGAFGLATSVWLHDRKIGYFYLIGASIVAFGRVLSNVHFPIVVAGGAIIGIFVGFLFEKFHMKLPRAHAPGIFSLRFVGSKIPPKRKLFRIHPRTCVRGFLRRGINIFNKK